MVWRGIRIRHEGMGLGPGGGNGDCHGLTFSRGKILRGNEIASLATFGGPRYVVMKAFPVSQEGSGITCSKYAIAGVISTNKWLFLRANNNSMHQ